MCTLEDYSSILLQQVDKNGVPVPFDCINTDIKVFEGKQLVNHIKPGFRSLCSRIIHNKYSNHPSRNMPLGVWGSTEGNYDLVVHKGKETLHFKSVEVKKDPEDKCRVISIILTVQFKNQSLNYPKG